jgi:hypothetical protein
MFRAVSTALALLLWTAAGIAQMASSTHGKGAPTPHADRRYSTLLARSDMQQPKPIPTVNPLRYTEIPVAQSAPEVNSRVGESVEPHVIVSAPQPGSLSMPSAPLPPK